MNNQQTGGVDPGLAALIASILSGSITAYGISKDTRSKEERIKDELRRENEKRFKAAEEAEKNKDELTSAAATATKKIADLEAEVASLKKRNTELESSASTFTNANETFKRASSDVLKAAIPGVIAALSSKYAWVQPETPNLKKALLYPTEYAGRLVRMSLYDFYQKRVAPAMAKDMKPPSGGRRRYRRRARGGTEPPEETAEKVETLSQDQYAPVVNAETKADTEDFLNNEDAPVASKSAAPASPEPFAAVAAVEPVAVEATRLTSIPPYEEFAMEYTKAIEEASKNIPTARQAYNDKLKAKREGIEKGKRIGADIVAKKTATTLIGKLESAIKDAEAALAISVPEDQKETLRSLYDALEEKVKKARDLVGMVQPDSVPRGPAWPQSFNTGFGWHDSFLQGGATTLREVNTEDDWSEVNKDNQATGLLDQLKAVTKSYIDAVKLAKESSNRTPGEKFLNSVEPVTSEADLRDSELKSIEDTIANRLREAEADKSFEGKAKIGRLKSAARTASQARERVKTARNKFKDTVTQYERKVKEARKTLRAFRKSPEDVEAANTTLRLPPTEAQSEVSSVLDEAANVKLGLDDFLEGKTAEPVKAYESNEGAMLSDLFTRKRMAKESAKADILAEALAPPARDTVIRRTSTAASNPTSVKGGKARKRTLKKRRGGK